MNLVDFLGHVEVVMSSLAHYRSTVGFALAVLQILHFVLFETGISKVKTYKPVSFSSSAGGGYRPVSAPPNQGPSPQPQQSSFNNSFNSNKGEFLLEEVAINFFVAESCCYLFCFNSLWLTLETTLKYIFTMLGLAIALEHPLNSSCNKLGAPINAKEKMQPVSQKSKVLSLAICTHTIPY